MSKSERVEGLMAALEEAVRFGLARLSDRDAGLTAREGEWGPRDVLAHMVFWHRATVEGIESVASGGPPYRVDAQTDEVNEREVARLAGASPAEIVDRIGRLQVRLVAGARALADPEATVVIRSTGAESSATGRLRAIADHWREHVSDLRT